MSEQQMQAIVCGKNPAMAAAVKQGLLPQTEVIHIILSVASGVKEIPAILRGEVPKPTGEDQIGTGNYSRGRTAAVVTGGGYDDAMFQELRDAGKGDSQVPWLRPDMEKPGPRPLEPGYKESVVERVKERLSELRQERKLEMDGVYYY